jgi:type II secretory pathway pseudopilin PulG
MKDMQKQNPNAGFTLVEVLVAASIMIILCVGLLTVFSHTVRINAGNSLRSQAQSVLQKEVEYYRSLRFVPTNSDAALNGAQYPNVREHAAADCPPTQPDGCKFVVSVDIDNIPSTPDVIDTGNESTCKFKQITITAVPKVARAGWLDNASLGMNVTIQRVRSN